jgi:hypothetical protein
MRNFQLMYQWKMNLKSANYTFWCGIIFLAKEKDDIARALKEEEIT